VGPASSARELQTGLWHWEAPHPDWEPSEPWSREVSSYAIDDGRRLLLFDPLGVPIEIEELAPDREPVVVLTCPWHERDTQNLVERLDVPVFAPAPETREDLMEKFGVAAEQVPEGSPDLRWLKASDTAEKHWISAGERLPVGVEAFPGKDPKDLVLWIESSRALVFGDTLAEFGRGLELNVRWLRKGETREQIVEVLRPAARAAGRARPPDTRGAHRPRRPRARALLRPHLLEGELREHLLRGPAGPRGFG
jgi:glyoxylase-like metal-dependent hydrolase (beta-lactamase superfamily II)